MLQFIILLVQIQAQTLKKKSFGEVHTDTTDESNVKVYRHFSFSEENSMIIRVTTDIGIKTNG